MSAPTINSLQRRIAKRLTRRNETLACVEIESGGLVSRSLTSVPGSSAYFAGALILAADAALWPQAITSDGSWQHEPPGSHIRLDGAAAAAQQAFGAHWGLAVECVPAMNADSVHLALRTPNGSSVLEVMSPRAETISTAESAELSHEERLVQCILRCFANRLQEICENLP